MKNKKTLIITILILLLILNTLAQVGLYVLKTEKRLYFAMIISFIDFAIILACSLYGNFINKK